MSSEDRSESFRDTATRWWSKAREAYTSFEKSAANSWSALRGATDVMSVRARDLLLKKNDWRNLKDPKCVSEARVSLWNQANMWQALDQALASEVHHKGSTANPSTTPHVFVNTKLDEVITQLYDKGLSKAYISRVIGSENDEISRLHPSLHRIMQASCDSKVAKGIPPQESAVPSDSSATDEVEKELWKREADNLCEYIVKSSEAATEKTFTNIPKKMVQLSCANSAMRLLTAVSVGTMMEKWIPRDLEQSRLWSLW